MLQLRVLTGLACLCSAQGCSAFASSHDRVTGAERDPAPINASACRQGSAAPGCGATPAFAAATTGSVQATPLGPLQDAATHDGGPADAGLGDAATGHGVSREAGATNACTGLGESLDLAGGSCYLRGVQATPWAAAREACVAWGGALARIESADEARLLASYLVADTWIGASDLSQEGTFTWTDGAALTFSSWADAQPDDFGGAEDCVELLLRDGAWNDQQCSEPKAYLCERPLE